MIPRCCIILDDGLNQASHGWLGALGAMGAEALGVPCGCGPVAPYGSGVTEGPEWWSRLICLKNCNLLLVLVGPRFVGGQDQVAQRSRTLAKAQNVKTKKQ